jgi:DNA-binding MarR family transcriptional regulator
LKSSWAHIIVRYQTKFGAGVLSDKNKVNAMPGRATAAAASMSDQQTVRRGAALDLGPLDGNIGFHLRLASIAMERALSRLAGEDLRMGYFPVLLIIKLNPKATQTAIAEAVGLRRSSLVPVLKKLEQFGWIERTGDEGDKRANRISLTPKGETAYLEIGRDVEGIEQDARSAFGSGAYTRLVELLKQVQVIFGE